MSPENTISVKLNSRCFIRDGVASIIFTEVTLKLYCVEIVKITWNIQYLRVNSLVHVAFFIKSKMSGFEATKQHMREVLLFCFNLKKCAAECHRLLQEAYGEYALSETTCRDWLRRFKSGNFDLKDKERLGQPKNLKTKTWRHYSMKPRVEIQDLLRMLSQPISFINAQAATPRRPHQKLFVELTVSEHTPFAPAHSPSSIQNLLLITKVCWPDPPWPPVDSH